MIVGAAARSRRRTLGWLLPIVVVASMAAGETMAETKERACAADAKALTAVSLETLFLARKGNFKLDRKSECMTSPDGDAVPVVLFELPPFTQDYSIELRSRVSKTVLVPRVELLDATHTSLRTMGLADMNRRGDSLSLEFFMTDANTDERMLLIYADPDLLGEGETRTSVGSQTSYIGTGYLIMGRDENRHLEYVNKGKLVISLKGPHWEEKLAERKRR